MPNGVPHADPSHSVKACDEHKPDTEHANATKELTHDKPRKKRHYAFEDSAASRETDARTHGGDVRHSGGGAFPA